MALEVHGKTKQVTDFISTDRLALRFRKNPTGKAFADKWKTARVIHDLGQNNSDRTPPM